jgi:adenosylhomocysteine nucleosidase
MKRALFIAAERREYAGFPNAVRVPSGLRWEATWRGHRLLANGPGYRLASEATKIGFRRERFDVVVSTGFCGAFDPQLKVGDIFVASELVDVASGKSWQLALPPAAVGSYHVGKLLSINHVVQTKTERDYYWQQGFSAVEMEAAGVAMMTDRKSLPLYAIRVVTDTIADKFSIDFNKTRGKNGLFQTRKILGQAFKKPWKGIPELFKLHQRSQLCSRKLGEFMEGCGF